MIDYDGGRPHGNCNHTGTSYDALTGYVTDTYTMEWTDKSGTRWRKTCTVINLGKPDRGVPVANADAALRRESLPYTPPRFTKSQNPLTLEKAEKRHFRAMELFRAYMLEHGPVHVDELLGVTEWTTRETVYAHLRLFPNVYRSFRSVQNLWGLHGQEPQHVERTYNGLPGKMRAALLEHGPMPADKIAKLLDAQLAPVRTIFSKYDDLFVGVGKTKRPGIRKHWVVWGVRGIHDTEAA